MRMYLTLDAPVNPDPELNQYETHQIYELDLNAAIAAGETFPKQLLGKSCKDTLTPVSMCEFEIQSAQLNRYLSTKIPVNPWSENDILCSRLSPYGVYTIPDIGDYYKPDETYYTFEPVEQTETAPEDWGIATNYFEYSTQTTSAHTWDCYYNVKYSATYDKTKVYYKDVHRNAIKVFYTANGYSFGVYRCGQYTANSRGPISVAIGGEAHSSSGGTSRYHITKPDGSILYYYNSGTSGSSTACGPVNMGSSYNASNANKVKVLEGTDATLYGCAASLCFIHFQYENADYYGIAIIDHTSFASYAMPTAIKVIAYTSDFWGGSIISGGDGGNWGEPSVPAGGDGTFSAPSDNRGTGTANDFTNPTSGIMKVRQTKLNGVMQSVGIKYYGMRKEPNESIDRMSEIINWMFDPQHSFMSRFTQSLFNPISGVLSCHLIPSDFYEVFASDVHVIISGYDFTQEMTTAAFQNPVTAPIVNTITHKHFEKFDIGKYFGAFPDFEPYTRFVLHLPYIGNVEIAANAISQGSIAVDYMCDVMNGNVCAFVWCKDRDGNCTYRYTATGNCAVSIPMYNTNQDFSGVGKIANGAISLIGMARSPISGAISAATGILSGIYDLANMHQSTNFAGTLSGNIGMISDLVVWLEAVRPVWVQPESYQNLEGVPLQMSGTIETISVDGEYLSGYTEISKIELDNVDATDSEKREIERLLLSGVWIERERF